MKIKTLSLLFCCMLLWMQQASAQQNADIIYLKSPAEQYQSWLDKKGLGEVLQVYDDRVKEDSTQIVYLEFAYHTTDSASVAWKQLQQKYQEQFVIGIEEALYYQALHFYPSNENNTIVYICDSYERGFDESCLNIAIYTNDQNYIDIEETICKSYEGDIELELPDFKGMTAAKAQKIKGKYEKDFVFDNIYAYAEKYYKGLYSDGQIKRWMSKENTMRFEVWNLQEEILVDEAASSIQQFLNWCCNADLNWAKREMLVFTIHYEKTGKEVLLHCMVQGKFGSGFYEKIDKAGYIDMEQVPRFEEYLKDYADEQLKQYEKVIKSLQK